MGLFIFFMIVVFAVAFVSSGLKIVQQSETMIIERLGTYFKTAPSGINIIIPVLDQPRKIEWRYTVEEPNGKVSFYRRSISRIDLRETVYAFPRQNVITKDNVVVEISAILYFQIIDPVKAVYEIANLPDAIEKLTQTTLRNVIGELDLDESLSSRDTINSKLKTILDQATNKWGVKVNRVELQDINPPADIRNAMEKQMRAERDRRAAILEAEGFKQSKILESEGFKESEVNRASGEKAARILDAEGEAEARVKVAEAEAEAIATITKAFQAIGKDPIPYLLGVRYIDTLKEMVSGQGNKVVYLPYEATSLLGSLGGIKELLNTKDTMFN